jgi:hypothetical protein
MCNYDYAGYGYESLNFQVGKSTPQNPSCQKVQVVKKVVPGQVGRSA